MDIKQAAFDNIDQAADEHKIEGFYALFSGGTDSLALTHVVANHPLFRGVIHINTKTGIPETEWFVQDTCTRYGWDLYIAAPFDTYESLLVRWGFPGPQKHPQVYQYLKERPLNHLLGTLAKGMKRFGLMTGVRKDESTRRMLDARFDGAVRDGRKVWVSPISTATKRDTVSYLTQNNVPTNPVSKNLGLSGECLCGCFARAGEEIDIKINYPDVAKRIERWRRLVQVARELNPVITETQCEWGHGQEHGSSRINPPSNQAFMQMCFQCEVKAANHADPQPLISTADGWQVDTTIRER